MRSREEVRERVKQIMQQAPQEQFNILDHIADLLKGTNVCVATYVKRGNKLLISANTNYVDQEATSTKYDDECMLDYMRGFKPVASEGYQDLNVTLAADKRLKNPKYLRKLKVKLDDLFNTLKAQIAPQYIDHDSFAEEDDGEQQNADINRKFVVLNEFFTKIQDIRSITPENILVLFDKFQQNIAEFLTLLNQADNQEITQIMNKIFQEDLRFIETLNYLLNDNLPNTQFLRQVLSQNFETVPEIGSGQEHALLHDCIIPLVTLPKTKINGKYHAEHRLVKFLDSGERNQDQDRDYIGISMHCCAMCYYIITLLGEGIQVAGTHREWDGASIVGWRLHTQEIQNQLLEGLFPSYNVQLDNHQQQDQVEIIGNNPMEIDPI